MQRVILRESMDHHSRDIFLDGNFVGFFQWHPERAPRIVLHGNGIASIDVATMETILDLGKKAMKNAGVAHG